MVKLSGFGLNNLIGSMYESIPIRKADPILERLIYGRFRILDQKRCFEYPTYRGKLSLKCCM